MSTVFKGIRRPPPGTPHRDAYTLFDFAEAYAKERGWTEFPTVRIAARGLRWSQARVEQAVDGHPDGGLQLTYYNTSYEQPLGDHFVETL